MTINQLLVVLLALLPKDGAPRTTRALAHAAAVTPSEVTNAMFDPWFAGGVGYDMPSDSYFVIRKKDPVDSISKKEQP